MSAHFKQAFYIFCRAWPTNHATWEQWPCMNARCACKIARSARQLQNIKDDKRRRKSRREKLLRAYLDKVVLMLLPKNGASPALPLLGGATMEETCNAGRGKTAFSGA